MSPSLHILYGGPSETADTDDDTDDCAMRSGQARPYSIDRVDINRVALPLRLNEIGLPPVRRHQVCLSGPTQDSINEPSETALAPDSPVDILDYGDWHLSQS